MFWAVDTVVNEGAVGDVTASEPEQPASAVTISKGTIVFNMALSPHDCRLNVSPPAGLVEMSNGVSPLTVMVWTPSPSTLRHRSRSSYGRDGPVPVAACGDGQRHNPCGNKASR